MLVIILLYRIIKNNYWIPLSYEDKKSKILSLLLLKKDEKYLTVS